MSTQPQALNLSPDAIRWAITSLNRFGDTDLFPRPVELDVLFANIDNAVSLLSRVDFSSYTPVASRRFLVPKHDLSYRQATQLDPLDSVVLTALVHMFGTAIEATRRPSHENSVFSHRFNPSAFGELYPGPNAWNSFWTHCHEAAYDFPKILLVDISDFYNQIYHHTIENQLIACGWPNRAITIVITLLESTTAKVSRGIPVGPHWTHLLAEASLVPVDNSLATRGLRYARFIDDIAIFATSEENARASLFTVAEVLDKQQRLHLQNSKTRILDDVDFQALCQRMIEDQPINDLERLMVDVIKKHSHGDPYHTVLLSDLSEAELRAFSVEVILAGDLQTTRA